MWYEPLVTRLELAMFQWNELAGLLTALFTLVIALATWAISRMARQMKELAEAERKAIESERQTTEDFRRLVKELYLCVIASNVMGNKGIDIPESDWNVTADSLRKGIARLKEEI